MTKFEQGTDLRVAAEFTVGAEASNVINVAVQLLDRDNGGPIDEFLPVLAYLSDDSGGNGVATTAPSGGWAIGTDGEIMGEVTANKLAWLLSENDGDIDLDITETGADTWYLCVAAPDGRTYVSGAITFAA